MADSTDDQVSEETVIPDSTIEGEPSQEPTSKEEEPSDISPELSKVSLDDLEGEAKELAEKRLKEMQAAFTKDRQEVSALRKKAEAYDLMQQQELLRQKFPKKDAPAKGETTSLLAEALGVDVSTLADDQRQQLEQLAKIVDFAAQKRVQEQIQPLQHDLMTRDFKQELESTKKKYSDFDEYISQIQGILSRNPQMGYEEAYKIATWEAQKQVGRTEAMANLEVKKKQTQPKSTASAKGDDQPKGFEEIFNWAKEKVGKG